jgi:DNA polymerase III sliding clamp (beta) subunit (PCNA family)
VLQALGEDEVHLDVTTPSSPGMLRPAVAGQNGAETAAYTHVVVPMFVEW